MRLELLMISKMTTQLNAELFRAMSIIAEDDKLMAKVLKYVKKLAALKQQDDALMTKEEFYANVDEALEQARQGRVQRMQKGESLDDFLTRVG